MSTTTRNLVRSAVAVTTVGAVALGWSLYEAHLFKLRTVDVPVLPEGSNPKRILHLSDLHMTPNQADKRSWVAALARLEPDLVVATGDFLAHRRAVPAVLDALGPLLDVPGVFTLGSNDYFAPRPLNPLKYFAGPSDLDEGREILPWRDLVSGLTRWGWMDLDNRRARIELHGWSIDARGVNDPHIHLDRYDLVSGPFSDSTSLRLGVTHAPYLRVLDGMSADGADLIMAGHTHGGQVRLPGYGALVANCDLDRKQAKGLSTYTAAGTATPHTSALHVSAGLGTSPYAPIRFACPPEATLLTLTPRS